MTATITDWTPSSSDIEARESRIRLALLRSVVENLISNWVTGPLFGVLICAMFSQWVSLGRLACWYAVLLAGMVPQLLVCFRLPPGELPPASVRRWARLAGLADLAFVLCWTSSGWLLWVPGNDFNHILIQMVLAATLAAHASLVGPSRDVGLPAFAGFGIAMTLTPLQGSGTAYHYLGLISPLYVGYIAFIAFQHHARAHAALVLTEDKNRLLAELVRAKQQADLGRERAEAGSRAKSQFLANMSHELRTPLNAIIGFSELIHTRLFDAEPERNYEYAGLIHSSGNHLLALINDILDLAKIEAGRWRLAETQIDVSRAAQEALQLVAWKAKANGAILAADIAGDLPALYADERAIKQILLNLLSNAVKFTPRGGTVTAFANADENGFRLGVSDTGIGISLEDQGRVFDSFGQGKHDVAVAERGTGLGLAIVKGLSEAHGGHVTLQSQTGKGTCVTVHLPGSRARMPAAAA